MELGVVESGTQAKKLICMMRLASNEPFKRLSRLPYTSEHMQKFILAFLLSVLVSPLPAADRGPNIIYIMADDLGYGDLSCFGQTKFKTPNIDRLASEGVTFTDYYAGSTVCAPTRCVLMTGLHTGHAFVRGNREVQPEGQAPMPADIVTLPRRLNDAGYTTGMFGKWGLGAPGSASDPSEHFDEFFGYNCQRQAHTFYPTHLWHNDTKVLLDEKRTLLI